MTGSAIALLVVALVLVWGGLIVAIIFINRYPEVTDLPEADDAVIAADTQRAEQPHPTRDT